MFGLLASRRFGKAHHTRDTSWSRHGGSHRTRYQGGSLPWVHPQSFSTDYFDGAKVHIPVFGEHGDDDDDLARCHTAVTREREGGVRML